MGYEFQGQRTQAARQNTHSPHHFCAGDEAGSGVDESLRELERACLLRPRPALRKALAERYLELGHVEDCIAVSSDLLERSPDDMSVRLLLARAQIEAGNLDAAARLRTQLRHQDVSRRALLRLCLDLDKARERDEVVPPPLPPDAFPSADARGDDPPTLEDAFQLEAIWEESLEEISSELEAPADSPEYYVGPTRTFRLDDTN